MSAADTYLYVDGSYEDSHDHAAWAWVAVRAGERLAEDKGFTSLPAKSRNIDGECEAVIQALRWAEGQGLCVTVVYDYSGIEKWFTGEWQAKKDVAQQYFQNIRRIQTPFCFKKVTSHTGDTWNDYADRLARSVFTKEKHTPSSVPHPQEGTSDTLASFGGEFALIKSIQRPSHNPCILKGIGDDAALIDLTRSKRLIVTKELFIEGRHFDLRTFTPCDIGMKALQATLSDIAAMGGKPFCVLVGLGVHANITASWIHSLYEGLRSSEARWHVDIIGGDTVYSERVILSLTAMGEPLEESLEEASCNKQFLRKDAQTGDLIKVTGTLGNAALGYELLRQGIAGHERLKAAQKRPKARLDLLEAILPVAHAIIDISDGLVGDLGHICRQSQKGAHLIEEQIPMDVGMIHSAKTLGKDPLEMALYGGEDYELLYTVPVHRSEKSPGVVIGKITEDKAILLTRTSGKKERLRPGGYDHFKPSVSFI